MVKDKHDPRDFEQFIQLRDDGTVTSTHMFAVGSPDPNTADGPVFVNVSDIIAVPLDGITVDAALVDVFKRARVDLANKALDHAQAFANQAAAQLVLSDAVKAAATKSHV